MQRTTQQNAATAGRRRALPFQGLGHGMERVRAAAERLTPREFSLPRLGDEPRRADPDLPRLSGFALLTALGREIRGR